MLFGAKVDTVAPVGTADGKNGPSDGHQLPASTADSGKIRLGGGFRLPVAKT